MIDTQPFQSPGWWMKRLLDRLVDAQPRYETLDLYLRNEQHVPVTASKTVRDAYRRLMRMAKTDYADLIVGAVTDRLKPLGFRTGADADDLGDDEAWRIWQANALDVDAPLVFRGSLALADAYMIVGGVDDELGAPLITPEDPRQVIVEPDPRRRRRAMAAVKAFSDDLSGTDVCYLYLPGVVIRARRDHSEQALNEGWDDWAWDGDPQTYPVEGAENVVPVVRFANRLDTFGRSCGEFEQHLGLLDRINYTILSRLEIATLQAFRQRAVKGVPTHDEDGTPIDYSDIFSLDPGALWHLPATAEMWESGQVDLGPVRNAVRDDVQDLAAVTRTPLFYLTPETAQGSAEGAALAREGLVFKCEARCLELGESLEQVMALAFLFAGDRERANRADMEVLWAPPERFTMQARYDAASKAQAAGVPWRTVMTDVLQFSPQKVDRMEAERVADLLATQSLGEPEAMSPADLKAAADAMGVLVRAGVDQTAAARAAGLGEIELSGAIPVSLRVPESTAAGLEDG